MILRSILSNMLLTRFDFFNVMQIKMASKSMRTMRPFLYFVHSSDHEGCHECKDCIELRKSRIDHCVGGNVMTL